MRNSFNVSLNMFSYEDTTFELFMSSYPKQARLLLLRPALQLNTMP